jgi:hypothetical protein
MVKSTMNLLTQRSILELVLDEKSIGMSIKLIPARTIPVLIEKTRVDWV